MRALVFVKRLVLLIKSVHIVFELLTLASDDVLIIRTPFSLKPSKKNITEYGL
jgi:hypothetical protein